MSVSGSVFSFFPVLVAQIKPTGITEIANQGTHVHRSQKKSPGLRPVKW